MKDLIKKIYASIAKGEKKTCCSNEKKCGCGGKTSEVSQYVGYSAEDLASIPEGSDMGLGCGNPTAFASLKEGEVVVDLGSGGGIDVFLASRRIGQSGKAIGIDMTEAMVEKARVNAGKAGLKNVEFKIGEIENIPMDDSSTDCIISNCVINLSSDKQRVFNEAYRILKPGGRLMVSDMVLLEELPQHVKESAAMYAGCVSGALYKDDYIGMIRKAGFDKVDIIREDGVDLMKYIGSDKVISDIAARMTEEEVLLVSKAVLSLKVAAYKPE